MIETTTTPPPRRKGVQRLIAGFKITVKRRLIAPMLRGHQEPEYFARGSAIGLFVAFTPSVGVQIPLTVGIWTVTRMLLPKWDFHLGLACAWTLLTSLATIPVLYPLFILTGHLMLGQWEGVNELQVLTNQLQANWSEEISGIDSLWQQFQQLWALFGLPLFIGSLPWGIGLGWIGYLWTIWFVVRRRRKKQSTQ